MALRYRRKKQSSYMSSAVFKTCAVILGIMLTVVIAVLLLVNGRTIHDPLCSYLSDKIGGEVSIEKVEFSPIYPGTIKVSGLTAEGTRSGRITLGEGYLEINLIKALFYDRLLIEDLYLKDLQGAGADTLGKIALKMPFASFEVAALRIDGIPIDTGELHGDNANVRLYGITLNENECSIPKGSVHLNGGKFGTLEFKELSFGFEDTGSQIRLNDVMASALGGTLSCQGEWNKDSGRLDLRILSLSGLILKDEAVASLPDFTAAEGFLNRVYLETTDEALGQLVLDDVSGRFKALACQNRELSVQSFDGTAGSLLNEAHSVLIEDVRAQLQKEPGGDLTVEFNGLFERGDLMVRASLDDSRKVLTFMDLNLDDAKLELKENLCDVALALSDRYLIKIDRAGMKGTEILSYLDFLPLSVREADIRINSLLIDRGLIKGDGAGLISLDLKSLLVSDLFVSKVVAVGTINDDVITLSLPNLTFIQSKVNAAGTLSLNSLSPSFILGWAHDFRLSELNSNLSEHLLSGTLNASINLTGRGDLKNLSSSLEGSAEFSSDEILISKFALDRINGGPLKGEEFTLQELDEALKAADCGISKFKLSLTFEKGRAVARSNFSLTSADVMANLEADLKDASIKGRATFASPGRDSVTFLDASGTLFEPRFNLRPQSRGQERPGLVKPKLVQALQAEDEEETRVDAPAEQEKEAASEQSQDEENADQADRASQDDPAAA